MTGQANTYEVENPYTYWRAAHESEQGGDYRGAEMGYKAAVMAADNLPMSEYRRNFQEELHKHQTVAGYKTPPGIGVDELKQAYAELLTLPFAARVRLANFLARRQQTGEALEICDSAIKLKLDDWVHEQQLYLEYRQQLDNIVMNLQYGARRATQTGKNLSLGQQLLRRQSQQQPQPMSSYSNLPDISELWEGHLKSTRQVQATERNDTLRSGGDGEGPLIADARTLVEAMNACLRRFVEDIDADDRKRLAATVSQPEWADEQRRGADAYGAPFAVPVRYYRFRASTNLWSLSVRATESTIELFAVPARDALNLSDAEFDQNMLLRYILQMQNGRPVWTVDGLPVYADDVRVCLRNAFKDLLASTADFYKRDSSSTSITTWNTLAKQLSELSQQRTNLAEKIVYQQEMVQNRIARDIHDGVIADLLALKRAYEAHATSDAQVLNVLEDVSQRLRNICSDLAPRDLQDWGLRTVVSDMAGCVAERMKVRVQINVARELPDIPQQVSLHIYRIIQECLNNLEKHSNCTEFKVELGVTGDGVLLVDVQDNGVGFDPTAADARKAAQGGMGLDSIRERVELIRCFYPAQLWIRSRPGSGTKTTVQINLGKCDAPVH